MTLRLLPRLFGGKEGFESQLRAASGRMSSNNYSFRVLTGWRPSAIKEAKKYVRPPFWFKLFLMLVDYIESEPQPNEPSWRI